MRFKTYIGTHTDLSRLIGEAQHELGPEAVIKTEYFTEGGFFGIGARKMVRVTAGVEEHPGESPFSIVARAIAAVVPAPAPAGSAPAVTESPWHPSGTLAGANGKPVASIPAPILIPTAILAAEDAPLAIAGDVPALPLEDDAPVSLDLESAPMSSGSEAIAVPVEPDQTELAFTNIAPPIATVDLAAPAPPVDAEQAAMILAVLTELKALRGEVDAIRLEHTTSTDTTSAGIAAMSPQVQALYRTMIDRELAPTIARHLVEQVEATLDAADKAASGSVADAVIAAIVKHCLARTVDSGPVMHTSPRVLMLIGPTGVGKTTTLAKLAASFHLVDEQQVALVTADTYRIAAIEQLRTFAQIINLPLEVVFDPNEFRKALGMHGEAQVVLVDTAGRSPKDEVRLAELKRFLEIDYPVETLLVVTATTKAPDLRLILDRFGELGLDGLIITKLDETSAVGPIIQLLWETRLAVKFLANGQNVPDDLVRADESVLLTRLAEQLVR